MPFDHGLRLNNRQRIANARAKPIKANKNQSVDGAEGLFLRSGSPQNVYLLPQHPNFHLKRCPRSKQICDHPNNEPDKISHPARASPDSRSTASQIEFAIGTGCKQYNARILVSENTFTKLKGTYRIRDVDDVVVKGKTQPVGVYEVLDYHTEETFPNLMEVVNHFKEGRKHYRSGSWNSATRSFKECLKINEHDKLSQIYVERCEFLKANAPGKWDGVWRLTSK